MPWHVLTQHVVHQRLPAGTFLAVSFQHIGVQPQRLIDLTVRLRRPPPPPAHQLIGCVLADELWQYLGRGARAGEVLYRLRSPGDS